MSAALPDWLMHRAAAIPNAEAVVTKDGPLTYAELDRRVERVAAGE